MNLGNLSNEQLLNNLHSLVGQGRTVLARLLAYLGEVEERRLDLESACGSLFEFCVRRLGMGDDEACRRVAAARLARRFPAVLGMIERGEIHLTALLLLREHLTCHNHEELLRAASGQTKSQVQQLIAERFARPQVPSPIQPMLDAPIGWVSPSPTNSAAAPRPGEQPKVSRVEPLSAETYKVQFTASAELKAKIERAANLMRHSNPSGDLGMLMGRAVDLLLAELEKRRLGKTTRPSNRASRTTRRGYVPRAERRAVFERDGEQCTFVDDSGRRCESRAFLELDHTIPRALGGADDASNLSVKCRAHNRLAAERTFGREYIDRKNHDTSTRAREGHPSRGGDDSEDVHPLQRGYGQHTVHPQRGYDKEMVLRALCGMGFRHAQVHHALGILDERWADCPLPPIETVLREALSVLA